MPEEKHTGSRKSFYVQSTRAAEPLRSPPGPATPVRAHSKTHSAGRWQVLVSGAQPSLRGVSTRDGSRPLSLFFPGGEEGL